MTDQVPNGGHQERRVVVHVNDLPVAVPTKRLTGLELKEAAIAQGVAIELGFQLIEELPHDRTRVVGDKEVIEVRDDSRFVAVAPDDNS